MKKEKLAAAVTALITAFAGINCVFGVSAEGNNIQNAAESSGLDFEVVNSYAADGTWANGGRDSIIEYETMGKDEVLIESSYMTSSDLEIQGVDTSTLNIVTFSNIPNCHAKDSICRVVSKEKSEQLKEWYRNFDVKGSRKDSREAEPGIRQCYIQFYDDGGEPVTLKMYNPDEFEISWYDHEHGCSSSAICRSDENSQVWQLFTEMNAYIDSLDDADAAVCKDGDINIDGSVDVADISRMAAYVKGMRSLYRTSLTKADMNGDGTINVTDISVLANYVKGNPVNKKITDVQLIVDMLTEYTDANDIPASAYIDPHMNIAVVSYYWVNENVEDLIHTFAAENNIDESYIGFAVAE